MHIETITENIKSRRSIFPPSYTDQDITIDTIKAILENANYAPTHRRTEPWRFTVMKGEGLVRLAEFLRERYKNNTAPEAFSQARYEAAGEKVLKANCVIAIHMQPHPDQVPEWEEVAAVACAVQNMWLTATAYGIGAYWSSPGFLDEIGAFLNIPMDHKCLGLFYMGYSNAGDLEAKRTPIEDKTTWLI
ncbi:nitroreductase [Dyadobacter jejuensis]|uniref:Nitroreductase n=1 Tax=Dyadobacter jejuensis TaxID=1082580 RepID=A0A316AD94_9BACT|nr:nitroreductase [Dyadobacter jejuensis]PWJ55601.1 nitroreductase [Dyadobacter jejuensis]